MTEEPEEPALALPARPMSPSTTLRIRQRVRDEARRMRVSLAEAALHGGFALGAVVWAVAAALG